jgi:hypothetical protein
VPKRDYRAKALSADEAKRVYLDGIAAGLSRLDALAPTGRSSIKTVDNWMASDREFAERVKDIRIGRTEAKTRGVDQDVANIGFADWRKQFLGVDTFPHQQAWIDLLEGREYTPRQGETYEPSDLNRLIVNVPPFHAKSSTLTIDYPVYRICMNPNVRIIIVSKRLDQAKKFLYAIKTRLTSNRFAALQAAYAPEGGFKPDRADGASWGMEKIYVRGVDSGEKDPTVEALGMGGQIYGSRADLIIMDDCIVMSNAGQSEQQIAWIESEVENRVRDGKILIVGTRLSPKDMYKELRNGDRYLSGRSPWGYLRQPAVLRYDEDPEKWETLWPYSTSPMETGQKPDENGMYPAWPGPRMHMERNKKPPRIWALVYQQEDISDDSVFHPTCVAGSVNRMRKPGPMAAGAPGHAPNGMEGQYIIASMDPAMTGDTFSLVMAVDKYADAGKVNRRILNAWLKTSPTPAYIRDHIKMVTEQFGVDEWVIEQNAFQLFLIHDEDINRYLQQRGVKLTPHYTSRNKQDPDFGVASVAPLFGNLIQRPDGHRNGVDHAGDHIIELPDPDKSEGIKALIEQLTSWQPGKLGKELKMDGPMALWFAELRARSLMGIGRKSQKTHLDNPYLSRSDRAKQSVVTTEAFRKLMEERF